MGKILGEVALFSFLVLILLWSERSVYSDSESPGESWIPVELSGPQKNPTKAGSYFLVLNPKECGSQGCPYRIVQKSESAENSIGSFFGQYQILKSSHKGLFDISVESNLGGTNRVTILKFNGKVYGPR